VQQQAEPEKYSERALRVGFQRVSSRRVLDVHQCLLATPAINTQYSAFRRALAATHEQLSSSGAQITKKKKKLLASQLFRDDLSGAVHSDPNSVLTQRVGGLSFTYKAGRQLHSL
jgi:hypothetical protein